MFKPTLLSVFTLPLCIFAGDNLISVNFEDNNKNWQPIRNAECVEVVEIAESGKVLKITDNSEKLGAGISSNFFPAEMGAYKLSGKIKLLEDTGCSVSVYFYDKNKKYLSHSGVNFSSKPKIPAWNSFEKVVFSPDKSTSFSKIQVHAWSKAIVTFLIDDLKLERLKLKYGKPRWNPEYKIKPSEKSRLTPADVIGPDGVVYPNWKKVGLQKSLMPKKPGITVAIEKFGAKINDDKDDSEALLKACNYVGLKGGGTVMLKAGTYHLDRPVFIQHSNIKIKGQGSKSTLFISRYNTGKNGVEFFNLKSNQTIGPDTMIWVSANPENLNRISVNLDGKYRFKDWKPSRHSGNTFQTHRILRDLKTKIPKGQHTLFAEAGYKDGKTNKYSLKINYDPSFRDKSQTPGAHGVIYFLGGGFTGEQYLMAETAKRGSSEVILKKTPKLKAGDHVRVYAPATKRWKKLTENACNWGNYRVYQVNVKAVKGKKVILDQPLRLEFPAIDDSYVQKIETVNNCSVEGFSFEQQTNYWMTSVLFKYAVNCSAKDIVVKKCGRHAIYTNYGKFCEIRDCVFDDAWFKGGGGTAYVGWERSYDCLMENVTTMKMRHAPLFQWSASGNVIRKSLFIDSDAQWHSGWTNENLFEQCVVKSVKGNGGYGFGMWASPPEDGAHGPNGPRNVIYNCDVTSPKTGLWIGGMNENWLIMYNRFKIAKDQPGIFVKTHSFDHIIKGNTIIIKGKKSPMVYLKTPDCSGVEIIDNKLYGGDGKFFKGMGKPAVVSGNKAYKYNPNAARPKPQVPSIYEWQLKNN